MDIQSLPRAIFADADADGAQYLCQSASPVDMTSTMSEKNHEYHWYNCTGIDTALNSTYKPVEYSCALQYCMHLCLCLLSGRAYSWPWPTFLFFSGGLQVSHEHRNCIRKCQAWDGKLEFPRHQPSLATSVPTIVEDAANQFSRRARSFQRRINSRCP